MEIGEKGRRASGRGSGGVVERGRDCENMVRNGISLLWGAGMCGGRRLLLLDFFSAFWYILRQQVEGRRP